MSTAGQLKNYLKAWKKICNDPKILSWLEGYKIPFDGTPQQVNPPIEKIWSPNEALEISSLISEFIKKGIVQPCTPTKGQFISNIFLTPKQDGSFRLIINLKELNKDILTEHFKLEDHKTVLKLLQQDNFMATIDLKDAYYLIPVDTHYRKYLRFQFEGKLYEFTCMAMGLSTAPYVYTKIMKPVVVYLREKGLTSVLYLDDFLLLGNTHNECLSNVRETLKCLKSLGFIVNYKKSELNPSKSVKYLGLIYNSEKMTVSLPGEKRLIISNLAKRLLNKRECNIREFAQFLGTIASACPAVNYGWVYSKSMEREKWLALLKNNENYEARMTIPEAIKPDLQWWARNIFTTTNPIKESRYAMTIFSDAAKNGWGVVCGSEKVHGFWSESERREHINFLELLAAFFGLKCFAKNLRNKEILLRIDNTTAIAYVNRMGGVQIDKLSVLAKEIWQWCERRQLWIFASYINTKLNVEADAESRALEPETEFSLAKYAYQEITLKFGTPEIDLFASRVNTKCHKYVSWKRDPGAWCVDAFTFDWEKFQFYAFPPFSLVTRVLQKIRRDRARGIVVVPYWPAQPWFPVFMKMLIKEPIYFQPNKYLLLSSSKEPHPIWDRITLVAGALSGKC